MRLRHTQSATLFPYTTLFRSEQKLNVKLAQKQILTPGLVQMVTVLALNKLELSEMISQELMENPVLEEDTETDRKSTRLNSSHRCISYAVFCLKKKKKTRYGR